jgi:hypothetical protein
MSLVSTIKVSITLDERVVVEARRLVGARGLSAFINEVVAQRLQQQRLLTLLAAMEAKHGPIAAATWEQARAELSVLIEP